MLWSTIPYYTMLYCTIQFYNALLPYTIYYTKFIKSHDMFSYDRGPYYRLLL